MLATPCAHAFHCAKIKIFSDLGQPMTAPHPVVTAVLTWNSRDLESHVCGDELYLLINKLSALYWVLQ